MCTENLQGHQSIFNLNNQHKLNMLFYLYSENFYKAWTWGNFDDVFNKLRKSWQDVSINLQTARSWASSQRRHFWQPSWICLHLLQRINRNHKIKRWNMSIKSTFSNMLIQFARHIKNSGVGRASCFKNSINRKGLMSSQKPTCKNPRCIVWFCCCREGHIFFIQCWIFFHPNKIKVHQSLEKKSAKI